jgi:hypothetical protein
MNIGTDKRGEQLIPISVCDYSSGLDLARMAGSKSTRVGTTDELRIHPHVLKSIVEAMDKNEQIPPRVGKIANCLLREPAFDSLGDP